MTESILTTGVKPVGVLDEFGGLRGAASEFTKGAPAADDRTAIIIKRTE